ncbi:MAG TPA: glycosyltransferase family 4 protein [Terriglobales bacterium]|nr:glycosyltransferase family 4 protein [Terriglobales bacterium]
MKIALIAPPHIAVPPADYGGTELFVAQLAEGLHKRGVEVIVYTNAESTVNVERRSLYKQSQWPIKNAEHALVRALNHESWAIRDASKECDLIHLQSPHAITFSRFTEKPVVLTLHGPHDPKLSQLYTHFPDVYYVAISNSQCVSETMPRLRTIYHGVDSAQYTFRETKQRYLSFIGRVALIKGTHLAIEVARKTGIPLKIAGDVQPINRDYFEKKIQPHIDGELIQYVGRADFKLKNDLLSNSLAMLFPIQWREPFGLVMVEAMACGTPVIATPGGSVPEIVRDGVSGYICRNVDQMVEHVAQLDFDPAAVRRYVEDNFSIDRMVNSYVKLYEDALADAHKARAA